MTGPSAGGWSPRPPDDEDAVRVAALVLAHLTNTSAARHAMGVMISASHQVVAGSNYRVRFTIDPDTDTRVVDATVWEQPWLDRTEITELTVAAARAGELPD
jgi:hypothetical protein